MKTEEIRDLSQDELTDKYQKLKKELFELRFQAKTGKLEKVGRIKEVKRDIARILTVKTEILSKKG